MDNPLNPNTTAIFAAGCFWCYEPIFRSLRGVSDVTVGYTGGEDTTTSYEQVSTGSTGHTEAIQVTFDPTQISYSDLLQVFWHVHDPTTLNRQGADVGPQYRSAIFYLSPDQKSAAENSKAEIQTEFSEPIVTEIAPAVTFIPAEAYHQQYYTQNPNQMYCQVVISPKIQKFRQKFAHLLASNS